MPDTDDSDVNAKVRGIGGIQPPVLLVDHCPSTVANTTALLERKGHPVHSVSYARDAEQYMKSLKCKEQAQPGLILLGKLDEPGCAVAFLDWLDATFEIAPRVLLFTELLHEELYAMPRKIRAVGIVVSPSKPDNLLTLVGAAFHDEAREVTVREN